MKKLCMFATVLVISITAYSAEDPLVSRETKPGTTRRQMRWDKLSAKIIPQIIGKNADFSSMSRYVDRAQCKVTITTAIPGTGEELAGIINYSWSDADNDELILYHEIKANIERAGTAIMDMERPVNTLKTKTLTNIFNIFYCHEVKTKKVRGGYVLSLEYIKSMESFDRAFPQMELYVDDNMKVTEIRRKAGLGNQWSVMKLRHRNWDGKWLVTGYTHEMPMLSGENIREEREDEYTFRNGLAFLASSKHKMIFPGSEGMATPVISWKVEDWKIRRRKEPLPIIPDKAMVVLEDGWEPEGSQMKRVADIERTDNRNIWGKDDWGEAEDMEQCPDVVISEQERKANESFWKEAFRN